MPHFFTSRPKRYLIASKRRRAENLGLSPRRDRVTDEGDPVVFNNCVLYLALFPLADMGTTTEHLIHLSHLQVIRSQVGKAGFDAQSLLGRMFRKAFVWSSV